MALHDYVKVALANGLRAEMITVNLPFAGRATAHLTDGEARELIAELTELISPPVYYRFTTFVKCPAKFAADVEEFGPVFTEADIKDALDRSFIGMIEEGCEFTVEGPPDDYITYDASTIIEDDAPELPDWPDADASPPWGLI
jgi:hypothetical protein